MAHESANLRRIAIGLGLLLMLPVTAHAQSSFTHRLTSIAYDYDNNGVTDATRSYAYDAQGRATGMTYSYVGDGATDLFVTEDDDAAQETGTLGYNADDRLDSTSVTRTLMGGGTEQFDVQLTFTNDVLTRVDATSMVGSMTNDTYTTLIYSNDLLDEIVERNTSDDSLVFSQTYDYTTGGDELPDAVTLEAGVLGAVTDMTWRTDGRIDDLSSIVGVLGQVVGGGDGDYLYDSNGRLEQEVWSTAGTPSSLYAEFQGTAYTKTHVYDAAGLKTREEIDIGSDASVEATRTFTWVEAPCVPAFIFASNGRPNFPLMQNLPYVPGTGAQYFENCAPVPESGFATTLLIGAAALRAGSRRRYARVGARGERMAARLEAPTRDQAAAEPPVDRQNSKYSMHTSCHSAGSSPKRSRQSP